MSGRRGEGVPPGSKGGGASFIGAGGHEWWDPLAAAPPPRTPCERARAMVKAIEEKRAYRAYGTGAKQDRVYLDESERKLFENDVREHCR